MTDLLYHNQNRSVLTPALYTQLDRHFPGGVQIANEGEEFYASRTRLNNGTYSTQIVQPGEYYCVNCPFCEDTRHRLWVNHRYGQPDDDGHRMFFLATCYNEDCLSNPENWLKLKDTVYGFRNANVRHLPVFNVEQHSEAWGDNTQQVKVEMPGTLVPLTQMIQSMPNHPAVRYMCDDRRYTPALLDKHEISFCTHALPKFFPANNRVIFPLRMDGELQGWQGRFIGDADWSRVPKYYGMPGMKKKWFLHNYDAARYQPFPVIVEGVTDQHVIGDAAMPILGKKISPFHLNRIVNTWPQKPVILILDPDAQKETAATVAMLQQHHLIPIQVRLPDGFDVGDYDRQTIWNIIYSSAAACGVSLPTR